ncbi:MAG: hypothetical protein KF855_01470 [Acidobacteria bacterium]|nr:hypothetical protein [Acidobacteriota bacterium]
MRTFSETTALGKLNVAVKRLSLEIADGFEHNALDCSVCDDRGKCCRDEHFVNVRITRLEAAAIRKVIDELPAWKAQAVQERIERAVVRYGLEEAEDDTAGYACPLLDDDARCLVHGKAKPMPCVMHACYEKESDLPPPELLDLHESSVGRLNRKVYGSDMLPLPIPLALSRRRQRP